MHMPGMHDKPTFWRHRKRGSDYKVIGDATVRCERLEDEKEVFVYMDGTELGVTDMIAEAERHMVYLRGVVQTETPVLYGETVLFYESLAQSSPRFLRPPTQFHDGRFVPIEVCEHSRSTAKDKCCCMICVPLGNSEGVKSHFARGQFEALQGQTPACPDPILTGWQDMTIDGRALGEHLKDD